MPEPSGSAADNLVGMLNVFVDPAATAKRAPNRLFWVWPLLILCLAYPVMGYLLMPYTQIAIDNGMAANPNMSGEQLERARSIGHMFTKIGIGLAPLFVIGGIALSAWLIGLMLSAMDVRSRFHDLFGLLAACSLVSLLQGIAGYFVIRSKADQIQSTQDLIPPFGLDIFLHDGGSRLLQALVGFFSIFEIWYLVILVFGIAYLTGASKSKALLAITPAWLIPLLFRILGAMFTPKAPS
jgi:hypothetical protein